MCAHTRDRRSIVDSSSSSPPSCTTHHRSIVRLQLASGPGHASIPFTRMVAMLNAYADVRICFMRCAPAGASRQRLGHTVTAVFGPRPPSPAVCNSEVSAVSTDCVITT